MEAGGLELTEESQDVYGGENVGQDYFELDVARLRYFGGTSNHWAGWSRALDPVDFVPKPVNPLSGWPIAQLDLDPYRSEADHILDIPSASEAPDLPFRQSGCDFRRFQFRWSPPTRFAEKYRPRSRPPTASTSSSTPTSSTCASTTISARSPARSSAATRPTTPASPCKRPRLLPLHRRHREPAAAAQLPQPGRPRASATATDVVGRFFCDHPHFVLADVAAARAGRRARILRPDRDLHARARGAQLRHAARAELARAAETCPRSAAAGAAGEFAILLNERVREPVTDLR